MTCCVLEDGKPCPRPGRWRPVLKLRVHRRHPPAEAELSVALCDEHREKRSSLSDWVTDECWEQICAGLRLAKRAEPDRSLTELGWLEVS